MQLSPMKLLWTHAPAELTLMQLTPMRPVPHQLCANGSVIHLSAMMPGVKGAYT
jgi:hypothetical protein